MDRYKGDHMYPAAPRTAAPTPHLKAPITPPLAASQAASLASSLFIASWLRMMTNWTGLYGLRPLGFRYREKPRNDELNSQLENETTKKSSKQHRTIVRELSKTPKPGHLRFHDTLLRVWRELLASHSCSHTLHLSSAERRPPPRRPATTDYSFNGIFSQAPTCYLPHSSKDERR